MFGWVGVAAAATVAVATRDLPAGATLSAGDLRAFELPPGAWGGAAGGGGAPAALVGAPLRAAVRAGEIVGDRHLGRSSPWAEPAKGNVGVAATGEVSGATADLVRPSQGGCRVLAGAPVLRRGGGVAVVQVPVPRLAEVLAADVAVAPPGDAPKCTGAPPPRSAPAGGSIGLVTVPALASDRPAGTRITAADVVLVAVPRELAASVEDPVGGTTNGPMSRGELLLPGSWTPGPAIHDAPPPVYGTVRVPAPVGAPWWPGDHVGVVGPDGCLSLDGIVAGSAAARAPGLSVTDPGAPAWAVELAARAGGAAGPALAGGELAVTAPRAAGPGVAVWLGSAPTGEGAGGWCRAGAGAAVAAPSRPVGPPSLELRLLDAANAPVVDAQVDFGPRSGAWEGQARPDTAGIVPVPGPGPQVWVRVARPGSDPVEFGTRVVPGEAASVGVVLPPSGRCPPTPIEAWSTVTRAFYWSKWQLPATAGPDWLRLEVEGPLVAERMLVSVIPAPDGGADLEIRGAGLGGGPGTRHLDAATWSALLSKARAAIAATPASDEPLRPPPECVGNGTAFRLEVGTKGVADGLWRRRLPTGSPEEGAVRAVLVAAGLDPDG